MNPLLSTQSLIPDLVGDDLPPPAKCEPRLRILLLTDTAILGPGGSERFLRNLLTGLDADRYEIDVVQLTEPPTRLAPSCCLPPVDRVRLDYLPIGAAYGPRAWRAFRELRRRVKHGYYDVIQSQHEKSDLFCALLPRGPWPLVRISNRRDTGFQKSAKLRAVFRRLNHRFDWIVAPSRAVLDQLQIDEDIDIARTRCLPNGVDVERFSPLRAPDRVTLRAAAGLPAHGRLIGCAARLVPVKRHQDLLDGFALIAEHHADAALVLIGGGPLEASLRSRAESAGIAHRVHFLGERREVETLLPLLDVFALCSLTEGMSNALLEAMACGLPVIATSVGGNPEVVGAEDAGILVPPRTPTRIAGALESLLRDPGKARAMGEAARRRIEQQFSIGAMLDGFDKLYRTCRLQLADS